MKAIYYLEFVFNFLQKIPDYENEIPKVEANEVIFRYKKCNSYINNKY